MPIEQIIVLALIQGITEFLPISSSGHLILLPVITGWRDQGLVIDIMTHMGSLAAILVYFWRDVLRLAAGAWDLVRRRWTLEARLLLYLAGGTIPAVVFGLILKKAGFVDHFRSAELIAWNAIGFGLLMYIADRYGERWKTVDDVNLKGALIVGGAQALALIPGTSRSGITMTAARFLGFERAEAARFSFLLGIPATAGAGILVISDAVRAGETITADAFLSAALTFVSAILAIAFLMAVLRRMSLLPFVVYRLILGAALLGWIYLF